MLPQVDLLILVLDNNLKKKKKKRKTWEAVFCTAIDSSHEFLFFMYVCMNDELKKGWNLNWDHGWVTGPWPMYTKMNLACWIYKIYIYISPYIYRYKGASINSITGCDTVYKRYANPRGTDCIYVIHCVYILW